MPSFPVLANSLLAQENKLSTEGVITLVVVLVVLFLLIDHSSLRSSLLGWRQRADGCPSIDCGTKSENN